MIPTALLLLADSRLPAGGHAHSGGLEPAVTSGSVHDVLSLAAFLQGRLATTGLVTAALTAAACTHAHATWTPPATSADPTPPSQASWARLDAEADARTPSPAQRAASRAQGRSLLRAARTTWPGSGSLDALAEAVATPHQAVVLGAAAAAAHATPHQAATVAAYQAVTGPASAAVRLLGLDPLAVHRLLAELAPEVDATAVRAAEAAAGGWARLPALSAPLLDLHAELHVRADLRLFES